MANSVRPPLLPSAVGLIVIHIALTALLKRSMLNEVTGLVYVSTSSQVHWRSSGALFATVNDTEKNGERSQMSNRVASDTSVSTLVSSLQSEIMYKCTSLILRI